jgi:hypothetical protein
VGWEYEAEPRFELLAPVEGALTCAPMAFSSDTDGVIEGTVWRDGSVPVIPLVFEYARFALGDGRQREASILVPPAYRLAYSLPNIRPTFQEPAVYISKSDADRIGAHLDAGEEVLGRPASPLNANRRAAPSFRCDSAERSAHPRSRVRRRNQVGH